MTEVGGPSFYLGNCVEVLQNLEPESVDAVVTDPPYGISFNGAAWDHDVPGPDYWAAVLRVLKPGGHLLSFSSARTYHRAAWAIEAGGFEVRDQLMWLYGSGFPKSVDISKAIDRQRHDAEQVYQVTTWVAKARDAAGLTNSDIDRAFGFHGMAGHWTSQASQPSVPTLEQVPTLLKVLGVQESEVPTEVARLLVELNSKKGEPGENWKRRQVVGTQLCQDTKVCNTKAHRKPKGLDAIPYKQVDITKPATPEAQSWEGWGTALKPAHEPIALARKPHAGPIYRNVLKHGTGALNIQASRVPSDDGYEKAWDSKVSSLNGSPHFDRGQGRSQIDLNDYKPTGGRWPANVLHDGSEEVTQGMGEASRFFYCPKPSKRERGEANNHPTVKPLELMAYLVRLVTPPGGLVLDPFMGSGTTGVAAVREGFRFLGIELDSEYFLLAKTRIENQNREGALFD